MYRHDTTKAKELLTQAGYPDGFSLTLKLPPPSYARRSGEIVAAQLAQIGIRVRIENLEWAQWLDQVYTRHDFDMSIVGHAEPLDYDIYARDDYYFGYSNAEYKGLIAALDDSTDEEQRTGLLHRIQRKLAPHAVNGFLFQYPKLDVWNAHLHGIDFDNVLGVVDVSRAYFDDAALGHGAESAATPIRQTYIRAAGIGFCTAALALLLLVTRRFGSAYLTRRLSVLLATLLAATAIVFVIVQVVPGDPVRYMMGLQADPDTVAAMRRQLGLDAAPWQRYLSWLGGLLRGDFGVSYTYRVPVSALLAERLQVSLPLAVYPPLLSPPPPFPPPFFPPPPRRPPPP